MVEREIRNHPILTITLNPALDVTTSVERLEPRQKLRCSPPRQEPGGGGINVSRAIRKLGGESTAFIAVGGATGERLRSLLDEEGVIYVLHPAQGDTRTSFTVTERASGQPYRFVLPGPDQAGAEEGLLAALADYLGEEGFSYVVASGSVPPGLSDDVFAKIARLAQRSGARFLLDTSGPALASAGDQGLFLIKPNREEALFLLGTGDPALSDAQIAREVVARQVADAIVLTLGPGGIITGVGDRLFRVQSPDVEVRSTVGAGDSFLAGLTLALARDWSLEEACRFGIAAAASTVTTEGTELCDRAQTEAFFQERVTSAEPLE